MTWIDWGILLGKVVIVFAGLLVSVLLFIWMERKVIADMQTRSGPMRAGPRGVLHHPRRRHQALLQGGRSSRRTSDPCGLPAGADLRDDPGVPRLRGRAVRPFRVTSSDGPSALQLADLYIGVLWVLAMTSIGVYARRARGLVERLELPAARRGALQRADDQLRGRDGTGARGAADVRRPPARPPRSSMRRPKVWYVVPQFPAFVVFLICALAEDNRPPFDLAEAEPSWSPGTTRSTRASSSRCSTWAST